MEQSCELCEHQFREFYYSKKVRGNAYNNVCAAQQYQHCDDLPPAHSCPFYTKKRGWFRRFLDWIW